MSQLTNHEHLFIDGGWKSPSTQERISVISPATEEVIGGSPSAGPSDIDLAVDAARAAFDAGPWPRMSPSERATALGRLTSAIRDRAGPLADMISAEVGSPRKWATHGQVSTAIAVLDVYTAMAPTYPFVETRTGAMGNEVRVRRVPVGVVAAIVPWNAPLFVAALKLGPGLMAGCTFVLKPAPEAALDSFLLAEAVIEAGLPPGVLNIVPAGGSASELLVRHRGVDNVSFTGSTTVGRRIGELCGSDVRRCTLELGGKSAAILLDDVQLNDRTVRNLVGSAMANNGQVCAAQTRVLAPRSRYAEIVDALGSSVRALQVGDPFDDATDVGPVATSRQRDRIQQFLETGRKEGAVAVVGGGRPARLDRGWYIEPTLFSDVDNAMTIAREEIFGPVLAVIPYDGDDDAVAVANDSEYGLTGTVWTADPERGERIAERVRAGVLAINSPAAMDLNAPFGGFKMSGVGRECGPEAVAEYTEYQTIVLPRR